MELLQWHSNVNRFAMTLQKNTEYLDVNPHLYNGGNSAQIRQWNDESLAEKDGFNMIEITEFMSVLNGAKPSPASEIYVCHICNMTGHYIDDCPKRFHTTKMEFTPYQGRRKCYGRFYCTRCRRKWSSVNSRANIPQKCLKCAIPVYPHKQLPVEKAVALGFCSPAELEIQVNQYGYGQY